jgi:serine/threonine protein phosphatase PrpC
MEKLEVCYRSDKGRKRDTNEDSVLVREFGQGYLLAVADGVGGHAAGEVASRLALIELEEFLKANQPWESPMDALRGAIDKANKEIYLLARENPAYGGMSSTLVAALVLAGTALIANVGDSRAYLLGPEIRQITKDHSLVQELLDKKIIRHADVWHHPQKNIITRVLGMEADAHPDLFQIDLVEEVLLLCSDGLTDVLKDEEIREIVAVSPDLEMACVGLITAANEKGGKDNITVILARERQDAG